jgi:hypothetical protein
MVLAEKKKDQWIRIEDPDINPHIYSQLNLHKGTQSTEIEEGVTVYSCSRYKVFLLGAGNGNVFELFSGNGCTIS